MPHRYWGNKVMRRVGPDADGDIVVEVPLAEFYWFLEDMWLSCETSMPNHDMADLRIVIDPMGDKGKVHMMFEVNEPMPGKEAS